MGAPPRLKIKDELHYRKGHTNEGRNCRHCVNFQEDTLYDGSRGMGKYSIFYRPERLSSHPAPGRRNIGSRRISQWVLVEDDKQ